MRRSTWPVAYDNRRRHWNQVLKELEQLTGQVFLAGLLQRQVDLLLGLLVAGVLVETGQAGLTAQRQHHRRAPGEVVGPAELRPLDRRDLSDAPLHACRTETGH